MWQHVKLSVQIRPWDALACCWDVKQQTNRAFCYTHKNNKYLSPLPDCTRYCQRLLSISEKIFPVYCMKATDRGPRSGLKPCSHPGSVSVILVQLPSLVSVEKQFKATQASRASACMYIERVSVSNTTKSEASCLCERFHVIRCRYEDLIICNYLKMQIV